MDDMICEVRLLGLVPYQQAWELQDWLAKEIAAGQQPPTLLLLEHPHSYTFGRRGQAKNMLWNQAELERRGASVYWVDRGGDVTYHGPGQLVGYPLLPLAPIAPGNGRIPQADYVGYLRNLEQVIMQALQAFGVAGERIDGLTGVWIPAEEPGQPPAKIAAIGVKVDAAGISRHGFALNVDPEMEYWDGIIGCGLEGYPVTSLARILHKPPAMESVIDAVLQAFAETFRSTIVK